MSKIHGPAQSVSSEATFLGSLQMATFSLIRTQPFHCVHTLLVSLSLLIRIPVLSDEVSHL